MNVQIDALQPAALDDADNFRSFKVVCTSPREDCKDAFAQVGRLDGDHLWVDADWIRSNGPIDEKWHAELVKMIDYAASAGWVDAAGAIRAHIEDI